MENLVELFWGFCHTVSSLNGMDGGSTDQKPLPTYIIECEPSQIDKQGVDLVSVIVNEDAIDGVAYVVHQRHFLAVIQQDSGHIVAPALGHGENGTLAVAGAGVLDPLTRQEFLRGSLRIGSHHHRGARRPVPDRHS